MAYQQQTLNRAIIVANDTATQIRKTTKDEAELILSDARKNASRIIFKARLYCSLVYFL